MAGEETKRSPFSPIWIAGYWLITQSDKRKGTHMHKMLSKRAPVFQARLIQMVYGSSQAVILFARSGTNSNLSSSSVLVHTKAATSPPALVPVITRGRSPASRKAFTTPTWSAKQVRLQLAQKQPMTYSSQTKPLQRDIMQ